jgi:hypothetical protein
VYYAVSNTTTTFLKKEDKDVKSSNVNDITFIKEKLIGCQVKCINIIDKERPYLTPLVSNLFDTYRPCLVSTLYDTLDVIQDKICLTSYYEKYDKLIILGDVDISRFKKIFDKINFNFGITLPSSRYLINRIPRYKEIDRLLNFKS